MSPKIKYIKIGIFWSCPLLCLIERKKKKERKEDEEKEAVTTVIKNGYKWKPHYKNRIKVSQAAYPSSCTSVITLFKMLIITVTTSFITLSYKSFVFVPSMGCCTHNSHTPYFHDVTKHSLLLWQWSAFCSLSYCDYRSLVLDSFSFNQLQRCLLFLRALQIRCLMWFD